MNKALLAAVQNGYIDAARYLLKKRDPSKLQGTMMSHSKLPYICSATALKKKGKKKSPFKGGSPLPYIHQGGRATPPP